MERGRERGKERERERETQYTMVSGLCNMLHTTATCNYPVANFK